MMRVIFAVLLALNLNAAARDAQVENAETVYRVNPDNTAEIRLHERWRALTAPGRTAISKVQIPFISSLQDVEVKSIKTLKKDGTVVEGDPSRVFNADASSDPLVPYFTDLRFKVFIPPNVETGDAIDYEAVIHIRKWDKPGDFWFSHHLMNGALAETVVLDLPADRKVALYENPAVQAKTEITGGRRIERWEIGNWTEQETAGETPLPLFSVSSIESWDALGAWIRSLNRSAAEPTPDIKALAAKLTAGKLSASERIAALYGYVATKVRYVAVEFGQGRFQPHAATEVLLNSYGDCKDQTALLSALLAAAGFKVAAVLTTPYAGVPIAGVPAPIFSHEFTAVESDGRRIFLDSSMGPVPPQVLPPGVRGRKALVIGNEGASVVEIPQLSPVPARAQVALKATVSGTGALEGSVRVETEGLMELPFRRLFIDAADADKERTLASLLKVGESGASIRQITHADPADLSKPFWLQFEVSNPDFFPASKTSLPLVVGMGAAFPGSFMNMKKPANPIPVEAISIKILMDLSVNPLSS